jgi:hypothetical protein
VRDERIVHWTEGWPKHNFGDLLSAWLHEHALIAPLVDADRYRLLGSAIHSTVVRNDIEQCGSTLPATIALWGCGQRDATPLDDALRPHCLFFGVRGPLTRDALGLPADTPIGDPGLLVPLLRPRRAGPGEEVLCVPHFSEPGDPEALRQRAGADALVSPAVAGFDELEALVDRIAGARFVLAGALHAAIVACAYGVPFGFWDTGFVDIPFKWHDFAASLGVELPFSHTVAEAEQHFAAVAGKMRRPRASDILGCCPFAVRPAVLAAAWCQDAGLDEALAARLQAALPAATQMEALAARFGTHNAARRARLRDEVTGGPPGVLDASRRQMGDVAQRLRRATEAIEAEVQAASFVFDASGPDLRFAAGSAGMSYLQDGWTTPNEVGPWAVEHAATVRIPATSGWWRWETLDMGLIAFAPRQEPIGGRRTISVRANDIPLGTYTLENGSDQDAVFGNILLTLPSLLRRRGGALHLAFHTSVLVSARELGIGTDERTLSFAPTYLKPAT